MTIDPGVDRAALPEPTLDDAIVLAVSAHRGRGYPTQHLRREPFIVHPLRVMVRMHTDTERIVAVLHDLVEDTPYTLRDLRELGYPTEIVRAIDHLARRGDERYEAYIHRVGTDALARKVKLADLDDNLAHNRGVDAMAEERDRVARYRRAHAILTGDTRGS